MLNASNPRPAPLGEQRGSPGSKVPINALALPRIVLHGRWFSKARGAPKLSSVVPRGAQMPVQAAARCDCVSRVSVGARLLALLLPFTLHHFFSLLPAALGLHFWALPTSSLRFPSAVWKSLTIR